ncbi:GntR family transcriptional regulator [Salsipaludibacter albus]|uniref:GntR family transcriptional regulator n=1 Tax=Salsipaludibacter albus TaxID=2849650 RepID=UPI001EE4CCA3|nr:GntR family transcriptional regulator [Salsipaludibacter albus]
MLLTIDVGDDRPLYLQVAASVRRAVVDGQLEPGAALPPTRDAAAALGVNPETVQRAYRLLADESVVVARVGRGTRVRDDLDPGLLGLDTAIDELVARAATLGLGRAELAARIAADGGS